MKSEAEESTGKGGGDLLRGPTGLLQVGDWQHSVLCHARKAPCGRAHPTILLCPSARKDNLGIETADS